MIKILFLALCLSGQTFQEKENDINFVNAVEEFVRKDCVDIPNRWWKNQIELLGHSSYEIRWDSCEDIIYRCLIYRGETRWLFWGLHHRDPEVRFWCRKALIRITACEFCEGKGYHEWVNDDSVTDEYNIKCLTCGLWHKNELGACQVCKQKKSFWRLKDE